MRQCYRHLGAVYFLKQTAVPMETIPGRRLGLLNKFHNLSAFTYGSMGFAQRFRTPSQYERVKTAVKTVVTSVESLISQCCLSYLAMGLSTSHQKLRPDRWLPGTKKASLASLPKRARSAEFDGSKPLHSQWHLLSFDCCLLPETARTRVPNLRFLFHSMMRNLD